MAARQRTVEERPHHHERGEVLLRGHSELTKPTLHVSRGAPLAVDREYAPGREYRGEQEEERAGPVRQAERARRGAREARRDKADVVKGRIVLERWREEFLLRKVCRRRHSGRWAVEVVVSDEELDRCTATHGPLLFTFDVDETAGSFRISSFDPSLRLSSCLP
jgi:hypothetical protein